MSSSLPVPEVASTVELRPLANINHALGANHDLVTGVDELIDNSIDAGARRVAIVFHTEDVALDYVAIHDDGSGMSPTKMEEVLRLGGHEAHSNKNIGRYGMGLKEGSFANGDSTIAVSKTSDHGGAGFQLSKSSFNADRLSPKSIEAYWKLRDHLNLDLDHGTTIIWRDLVNVYRGEDLEEAGSFLSSEIERLRKHIGIRYHRFLEESRIEVGIYTSYPGVAPTQSARPEPINPLGYPRSGSPNYPRELTFMGMPGAPGITAHIWTHRSKKEEFKLEETSAYGHQGFYVYDADRLITVGGWNKIRSNEKNLQLLRLEISDPRVIEEYVIISPQKGSVLFKEGFHDFLRALRDPGDAKTDLDQVYADAIAVVKRGNRRSGKAAPLSEPGKGIAPSVKRAVTSKAELRAGEPISVMWAKLPKDNFVGVDSKKKTIYLNESFRKFFNDGHGRLNDAPLIKTVLFLLFNDYLAADRFSQSAQATANQRVAIINAAAREMLDQLRDQSVE